MFKDWDFLPDMGSLINDWEEDNGEVREAAQEWVDVDWMRAGEVDELNDEEEGALELFKRCPYDNSKLTIQPNDIQ